MGTFAVSLVVLVLVSTATAQGPQVTVTQGTIEGQRSSSNLGDTIAFLGIPFAKPPVGELRFKNPQMHDGWVGVRETKAYGASCMQDLPNDFQIDEDCLFLNVWVPGTDIVTDRAEPLAVMVWIHGGGFRAGSTTFYPSDSIAALENVIIVSMNYRLDIFGFLSSGDNHVPGNMGMMDQHLALKWVQENIASFGGDKDRVTIFGESAGGFSVSLHILSPMSQGLFKRAISESGVETGTFYTQNDINEKHLFDNFTSHLGCSDVACLQQLTTDVLLAVPLLKKRAFIGPTVDGTFLADHPATLWESNDLRSVDFMAGTMRDEADTLFDFIFGLNINDFIYTGMDADTALTMVQGLLGSQVGAVGDDGELVAFYRGLQSRVLDQYMQNFDDELMNLRGILDFYNDYIFAAPTWKGVKALSLRGQYVGKHSYLYYMTHKGSLAPQGTVMDVGPFHGDDLLYVFGAFIDDTSPLYNTAVEDDQEVSRSMLRAWASFAKDGKPKYLDSDGTEHAWLPYDEENEYYLEFETDMSASSMKKRLLPRANSFWNKIVPALAVTDECIDTNPSLISRDTAETLLFLLCAVVLCLVLALLIVCTNSRAAAPKPDKEKA